MRHEILAIQFVFILPTSIICSFVDNYHPISYHHDYDQEFKTRPFRAATAELTRIFTLAFRIWAKTWGAERVTVERPFRPYRNGERTIGPGQKRQFNEKIYDSFGFRLKTNKADQKTKSVFMTEP